MFYVVMSLISPNVDVKLIIFSQIWPGAFSQNCWKKPCKASTNKMKHIHTQVETNIKAEEAVLSGSSVCFSDKLFFLLQLG